MYSLSTTSRVDVFISPRSFHPHSSISRRSYSHSISFPFRTHSNRLNFTRIIRKNPPLIHRSYAIFQKSDSKSSSQSDNASSTDTENDFVTRVLKENPSQVEPKFLIGNKLYTLKEKEDLEKKSSDAGIAEILKKLRLMVGKEKKREEGGVESGVKSEDVYLKDILREHRGKLYVPEQIFAANLSEEEEFDRDFESLPKLNLEDFQKYMKSDKVKLLTLKEDTGVPYGFRDFIVELKEIPGGKNLQRTKWAMKLDVSQAQAVLEEYTGLRKEIEKQTMEDVYTDGLQYGKTKIINEYMYKNLGMALIMDRVRSWVGKLPEYPHPVASSISSRMMVELGMLTAVMATAAVVVGGLLASAVFAMTSFVFAMAVYVVWPMAKPFLKLFLGLIFSVLERVWDNFVEIFSDGGIFSKLYEVYTFGGVSSSLEMLKPIMLVFLTMVLLVRFTLSRRPKNFRKWDIWQGIEFSQSKPQARVDVSLYSLLAVPTPPPPPPTPPIVYYLVVQLELHLMMWQGLRSSRRAPRAQCVSKLITRSNDTEAVVKERLRIYNEKKNVKTPNIFADESAEKEMRRYIKASLPVIEYIDKLCVSRNISLDWRQGIFSGSTNDLYNAATQERETTLNQLLIELDGFDTGKGVIFLGATNRMDLLDPALLRPGRFDRKIRIRPPNAKGRLEILKVHARKVKLSDSVDLSIYAQNLPGWTGAKLAQLLQEAALVAVRRGHNSILQSDVDDAVDRLTVGPKRVGIELGHQGQCRRATTEVGTAMTAHLLRQLENAKVERCDRISINPRGQTLSQVVFHRLDDESYMFERQPQLLHRLQVLLGGRAAEQVIYGRDTSRASVNYLADASWLARKIITIWNLENPMVIHGEPPPWRKRNKFVGPRLDFDGSLYDDYGLIEPPVNFNLDDEVAKRTEELMSDMYGTTVALLRRHHAALLKTVKVLLNQKEISGKEIDFILNSYPPHTPTSRILEEKDPGSLPFFKQEQESQELEYSLLTP
ncbi:hypothetical protein TEA_019443 [Camellia sinensis var. sinensis]|uniref:AAA+ ATPase domain-containing protein n=1 Tax=Camellia sinensis var. sinensis TaxID=542762 RepID=A0A4S4EMZ5_CAMSN|nr:hypothetical protein TEA_019443 [Camellia sinensis var. sinensis]